MIFNLSMSSLIRYHSQQWINIPVTFNKLQEIIIVWEIVISEVINGQLLNLIMQDIFNQTIQHFSSRYWSKKSNFWSLPNKIMKALLWVTFLLSELLFSCVDFCNFLCSAFRGSCLNSVLNTNWYTTWYAMLEN